MGSIAADAGTGIGGYYVNTHFPVEGYDHSFGQLLIISAPTVNAEIALCRWLGVGAGYRSAFYITKGEGLSPGTDMALRLSFYIGNKNNGKFNIPIGLSYGVTNFKYQPKGGGHIYADGNLINLHISPHFYPAKFFGFFFSIGLNVHSFQKIEYLDTDGTVYTHADNYYMSMYGIYFELGVAARLHLLPKLRKEKAPPHSPPAAQTITY